MTESPIIRYIRQVARFRWPIILLVFAFTGFFVSQLQHVVVRTDYKVFFGPNNPELLAQEALEDTYTNSDYFLIAVHTRDGDLFNVRHLQAIVELTEEGWQTPYSIRVDSMSNFQHTTADQDDLFIADLIEEPMNYSESDLAAIRDVALEESSLVHRLISDDGKTSGVMATLHFPEGDNQDYSPEVARFSAQLVDKFSKAYPDLYFARTGMTLFEYAMFQVMKNDMAKLVPIMLSLMTVIIFATLRSVSATVISLVMLIMAAVSSAGVAAWIGIVFTSPVTMSPLMVLTLTLANSMHILVAALQSMQQGKDKQAAITESLAIKFKPVLVTTITTIIGFSSLNFSEAPPLGAMGTVAAVGILIAWLFSIAFLPAAWMVMPFGGQALKKDRQWYLERTADFVISNSKACIVVIGLSSLILIALIPTNEFGDTFNEYFPKSSQLRRDTDFTTANMTGPYTLEFSLSSGEADGISSPEYLRELDKFAGWFNEQPEVMHVYVFSDMQKRLNKTMHSNDPAWYRIPDNRQLAAQYLLLYEMSLPYGLDLRSQINVDRSATKIVIILNEISSSAIRDFKRQSEAWLRDNSPEPMHVEGGSAAVMFVFLSLRLISGMLIGIALAFALISAVLIIALKDIRLGLISLIPNMFPAAVTLGIWGLTVGQIGMIASVITAATLGFVVDDTVHLLNAYAHARREKKYSTPESVRYALIHVGKAVWSTTIVLAGGFLVMAFSDFKPNQQLGTLVAMTISIAIVLDFFLLPALLLHLDRRR